MSMHLERDLSAVRKKLSVLGALVEEGTAKAIEFITSPEQNLDREISQIEQRVNEMEVDIEEDCLKILALHQPVAADLRFMIAVLKVNNDLERMGDQSMNIVSRVRAIQNEPHLIEVPDFTDMSQQVLNMVRMGLDALIQQDADLAREVVALDDQIDEVHAQNYQFLRDQVAISPAALGAAMSYGTISSNLERIGDLTSNIAEDVIFMIEGQVIRHQDKI
jgi:phosphate transport system protein